MRATKASAMPSNASVSMSFRRATSRELDRRRSKSPTLNASDARLTRAMGDVGIDVDRALSALRKAPLARRRA